jgi:hypothetical protein
MPDASERLLPLLKQLLPTHQPISMREFMIQLIQTCPELDGGSLFEYCSQASRPNETRGNSLSLMLSTGLRTLHMTKKLQLERRADSSDLWTLYPAEGFALPKEITHLRRSA